MTWTIPKLDRILMISFENFPEFLRDYKWLNLVWMNQWIKYLFCGIHWVCNTDGRIQYPTQEPLRFRLRRDHNSYDGIHYASLCDKLNDLIWSFREFFPSQYNHSYISSHLNTYRGSRRNFGELIGTTAVAYLSVYCQYTELLSVWPCELECLAISQSRPDQWKCEPRLPSLRGVSLSRVQMKRLRMWSMTS